MCVDDVCVEAHRILESLISDEKCAAGNCLDCPASSTSPAGSGLESNCLCVVGYTEDSGTSTCLRCASGTYKDQVGSSDCITCEAGKTSPPGSISETACSLQCAAGSTGPDGGPCVLCDTGMCDESIFRVCRKRSTLNPISAAGKYKEVAGSGTCLDCPSCSSSVVVLQSA